MASDGSARWSGRRGVERCRDVVGRSQLAAQQTNPADRRSYWRIPVRTLDQRFVQC